MCINPGGEQLLARIAHHCCLTCRCPPGFRFRQDWQPRLGDLLPRKGHFQARVSTGMYLWNSPPRQLRSEAPCWPTALRRSHCSWRSQHGIRRGGARLAKRHADWLVQKGGESAPFSRQSARCWSAIARDSLHFRHQHGTRLIDPWPPGRRATRQTTAGSLIRASGAHGHTWRRGLQPGPTARPDHPERGPLSKTSVSSGQHRAGAGN